MYGLDGACAVVTGGSRGIGAAAARRLAAEGANVLIGYRTDEQAAQRVAADCAAAGGRAAIHQADMAEPAEIDRLIEVAGAEFGRIDVLICCAGIEQFRALDDAASSDFDAILHVNARAPWWATHCALPWMDRGTSIIWTSSVSATAAVPGHALYAGSKAAVEAMAAQVAQELGPRGIRLNVVAPGGTRTDMAAAHASNYMSDLHRQNGVTSDDFERDATALGRWGEAEEIAEAITWMAGGASSYMTGGVLPVDGGFAR